MYVRVTNLCNNLQKKIKRIHPQTVHLTAYLSLWKKDTGWWEDKERNARNESKEWSWDQIIKGHGYWAWVLDSATNSSSRITHITWRTLMKQICTLSPTYQERSMYLHLSQYSKSVIKSSVKPFPKSRSPLLCFYLPSPNGTRLATTSVQIGWEIYKLLSTIIFDFQ